MVELLDCFLVGLLIFILSVVASPDQQHKLDGWIVGLPGFILSVIILKAIGMRLTALIDKLLLDVKFLLRLCSCLDWLHHKK